MRERACWAWLGANLVGFNVEWVGCIIRIARLLAVLALVESRLMW